MPALVSALKRVDLPTFGRPTIPHRTVIAKPRWRSRSRRGLGMQQQHGLLHITTRDLGPRGERTIECERNRIPLVGARRLQHVIDDVLQREQRIARMADADPQAPEISRAELRLNVAKTVVACNAAAQLQ